MRKILVITGNKKQYNLWCRENNVEPRNAVYVSSEDMLRGSHIEEWQIVKWGTWAERKDISQILSTIEACGYPL